MRQPAGVSRFRRGLLTAITATLSTLIALGLAEFGLREAGRQPWHGRVQERRTPPVLTRDPELGWRTLPGLWWFGP